MAVLIKQKASETYVKAMDSWTADSVEAVDFMDFETAVTFCRNHQLKDVEILVQFFWGGPDMVVNAEQIRAGVLV